MVERVRMILFFEIITQQNATITKRDDTKPNIKKNNRACILRFLYLFLYIESIQKK